jgi:hypothetical protein
MSPAPTGRKADGSSCSWTQSYFGSFWDKIQLEAGPNLIYSPWVWLCGQTQSQYIFKNLKKYKNIKILILSKENNKKI